MENGSKYNKSTGQLLYRKCMATLSFGILLAKVVVAFSDEIITEPLINNTKTASKQASYNTINSMNDTEIVIQKIANDVWPQNPKIYSQQGFVMELSTGTNSNNTIIGFIMYSYVKPEIINKNAPYMCRENASMWYDIDFKKHFNYFIDSF
eukprot:268374_1